MAAQVAEAYRWLEDGKDPAVRQWSLTASRPALSYETYILRLSSYARPSSTELAP